MEKMENATQPAEQAAQPEKKGGLVKNCIFAAVGGAFVGIICAAVGNHFSGKKKTGESQAPAEEPGAGDGFDAVE